MRSFSLLLVLVLSGLASPVYGQDTAALSAYLKTATHPVDFNSHEPIPALPGLMEGRNVLIVGESVSHGLRLYDTVQAAITRQLAGHGLKQVLMEFGRTYAAEYNACLHNEPWAAFLKGYDVGYRINEFAGHADFVFTGIDFERSVPFYLANVALLKGLDTATLRASTRSMVHRVLDTTGYLRAGYKGFQRYYKHLSADFTANDAALRQDLGERYERLKYYCTNPNVTRPLTDRNAALARNFLSEMLPLDTDALYYCEVGAAHSWPGISGNMANRLLKAPDLSGKIRILYVYCEDCVVEDGRHSSSAVKGLRGDVLTCFRNAARGAVTLYDLSGLPRAYHKLLKCGDLLLFVKRSG